MADLTSAGTGAGGLGTPIARWTLVFVCACGILASAMDGTITVAPLAWVIAGPAALLGSLLLTTPGASPLPLHRVIWLPIISLIVAGAAFLSADVVGDLAALNFAAYLVTFLIPRGNPIVGGVGSALLIGTSLAWALPQQPPAGSVAMMLGIPLGCVAAGVVWRLVLHWVVQRERDHRSAAARSFERTEAAAEAIEASRAELNVIGEQVIPVLTRIANGEPIDDELRLELAHAEAFARDRIRVPHLQHPELVAEISRLRRLGISVVLLGESTAPNQLIDPRLAEACRTTIAPVTSGRVTVRTLPANRAAAMSVVIQSGDDAHQVQWSATGELIASS